MLRLHTTPNVSGPRRKPTTVCIVNVYAPTAQRAKKFPAEYETFYRELTRTVRACRRKSIAVFVAGDFNSKLGLQRQLEDGSDEQFMGKYGKGTRNQNGDSLVDFLTVQKLYAGNTHCRHKMCRRTTWRGEIRNGNGDKMKVLNQIDYVCVPQRFKQAILNGRSYSANLFSSDHCMVVVRLKLSVAYGIRNRATKAARDRRGSSAQAQPNSCRNLQVRQLVNDPQVLCNYQKEMQRVFEASESPEKCLLEGIKEVAASTIPEGSGRRSCHIDYLDDNEIMNMSMERKALLEKMVQAKTLAVSEREEQWRTRRNLLACRIKKRCAKLRAATLNEVAEELEKTYDSQRKFAACRALKKQAPYKSYHLVDKHGFQQTTPAGTIPPTEAHYRQFFNPEGAGAQTPVDPWGEHSGPLSNPLSDLEMEAAMKMLRNGRAVGPDGIPGELLKYGGMETATAASKALNNMFIKRKLLPQLGEGLLIPLNKPGKVATAENTRPITLLNTLRKATSLAILQRILRPVEAYLPRSQSGFRPRRSTMDVAWMYGWLKAGAHRYGEPVTVYGIDMSKAFDSIQRSKLLWILEHGVKLGTTELRLIRTLLAETSLKVKVAGKLGNSFPTLLGIPQGDALSPVLFVVYLEHAMREVRVIKGNRYGGMYVGRRYSHDIMEAAYADDVDFICRDRSRLDELLPLVKTEFAKSNLLVNESKTEKISIMQHTGARSGYKKLGTHLDEDADTRMRIAKANQAFHLMWKVWRCDKVRPATRMKMYNACVKTILMYNIGTVAFSAAQLNRLDATHRRHLRYIFGYFYPKHISNQHLYALTETRPLRVDITVARWRCFRTALAQDFRDEILPVASAMRRYFHNDDAVAIKTRGAPIISIPVLLHRDLQMIGRKLKEAEDYRQIRNLARSNEGWKALVESIAETTINRVKISEVPVRRSVRKRKPTYKVQDMAVRAHEDAEDGERCEVGRRTRGRRQGPPHITLPHQVDESPVRKRTRQPQVVATQGANRTKRSLPNLSPLPEEVPRKRLKKIQAEVVNETPASRERIPRMAECRSVSSVCTL